MTTPEIANKSKASLLAAAKTLFWKFGLRKVTVQDICKEANLSKMTFYRSFKNKNALALELLEAISNKGFEDYTQIMAQQIPFAEKVEAIVAMKHESTQAISQEFLLEVTKSVDPAFQALLEVQREKSELAMRKDFAQAQKEGWIRQDLGLDAIFHLLGTIQEQLYDPAFMAMHQNTQEAIMVLTNFFFYGITQGQRK